MAHVARQPRMTFAEYLTAEAASETKHEFVNGDVYAMAGGTPEHAALAAALIQQLGPALQGRPCRVYSSDLRVRVQATGLDTYPDVTVVCGRLETDAEDPLAAINPIVLVEVVSESTGDWDRGGKAAHYRQIPTLREYVLVSQHEPHVEIQRRNDAGVWELHEARPGQDFMLESLGVKLSVSAIYEDPLARPSANSF